MKFHSFEISILAVQMFLARYRLWFWLILECDFYLKVFYNKKILIRWDDIKVSCILSGFCLLVWLRSKDGKKFPLCWSVFPCYFSVQLYLVVSVSECSHYVHTQFWWPSYYEMWLFYIVLMFMSFVDGKLTLNFFWLLFAYSTMFYDVIYFPF